MVTSNIFLAPHASPVLSLDRPFELDSGARRYYA